ncbi:MAG: hypothetical protein A3I68_00600 [Candidatus Melainabacteria bacterium RIFCSPLOWO2_02_FULL_35_15]|nr:MAG: hypothetical protein A3F80_01210 [Candidatus Melainabacteria bacterium RIFCSPLOWO2_12_FULL_35_11]OGI14350.1 MAG: hypothetical protein A3I68_00600 [Candidatus Melainabacteria bacterium RIFCSPLOWO2_02_FULL_35_15]
MFRKSILFLFVITAVLIIALKSTAETDSSSSSGGSKPETLDSKLNDLLADTKTTLEDLKKQKDKKARAAYKKLRLINKQVIKALNAVPPAKCLDVLDDAMQDLYSLVSELSTGISCGPAIIPPFLPGTDDTDTLVTPDCILPPEMRATPFNGAFSLVNPLYESARDVFRTDENENEMPDACEGDN